MDVQEKELEILTNIYAAEDRVRQRDLAEIVGLSLGMTNAIVKRLVQKGFLTIKKVNNRNIKYIVSAKGIEAITRRSYRYFKRTIKQVVCYREAIEELVKTVKRNGFHGLVLIGGSDLGFIVEHACDKYGIEYVKNDVDDGYFHLYSETYIPDDEEKVRHVDGGVEFLQDILMRG